MKRDGNDSKTGLLLFILVALVVGGGGWNYQRNVAREDSEPRPFRGYDDAGLELMADAYRQEIAQQAKRWESVRDVRTDSGTTGLVGAGAEQFEAVQRASSRTRGVKRELAERQATLKQIERETQLRRAESQRLQQFWRRLTEI